MPVKKQIIFVNPDFGQDEQDTSAIIGFTNGQKDEVIEPDKNVIKKKLNQSINKVIDQEIRKAAEENKKVQEEKLNHLVARSNGNLLRIKAVFPFDFFPDELIVDRNKVDIINREFLKSATIRSVLHRDITDVIVQTSLFFAKVTIVARSFTDQVHEIHFLKRHEAIRARRLIQGLVAAVRQGIDLEPFSDQELTVKIEELGQAVSNEEKMRGI